MIKKRKAKHLYKSPIIRRGKKYRRTQRHYTTHSLHSLQTTNHAYDRSYGICSSDVSKVNKLTWLIEKEHSHIKPIPGDVIHLTTRYGEYLPNAHIEKIDNGICDIFEHAGVYVDQKNGNGVFFLTSGSRGEDIPVSGFKYLGKQLRNFWTFGSCGARGSGGLYFNAKVNIWEYTHPENCFGPYSTKDWRRCYIWENEEDSTYFGRSATGGGIQFKNRDELEEYIKFFNGKIFDGLYADKKTLFCYFDEYISISQEKWDNLDLPTRTIDFAGTKIAKYEIDNINHTIIFYYPYNS